ncbi:S-layer homology domain-containing protein [Anaerotignum lactatifermentans]|uniref:S-layer homology domain-containing protein n=1 Tax=Anaerotignum lactatifermentans TaxID=160404 RepID=UPI0024B129BC|nr:S-layer homology domain-containing protein [Anaerotignum lactatifermentans]
MRNKVKRTLSFLLTFVMLCSLLPMTAMAAQGDVTASKTAAYNEKTGEVTITMTVQGESVTQSTASKADVVLVVDNSGSMKEVKLCNTPKEEFERHTLYYKCLQCGKKYTLLYSEDFCTNPIGDTPRIDTAKEVGKVFATNILSEDNQNKMAVIGFAGDTNWLGQKKDAIKVKRDLTNNVNAVTGALDEMNADGGTDYTSALQEAYNMLAGRGETDRPGYVIFISDGAPGEQGESIGDPEWDGSEQAEKIKDAKYQLYSIGIELDDKADSHLKSLASDNHYQNVTGTNYASELEELLKEWAEEINTVPAGTDAVMTDTINTEAFEYVDGSAEAETGTISVDNGVVTWNIGDIPAETSTATFKVKPIVTPEQDTEYKTNTNVTLTYKDSNDQEQTIPKEQIGEPKVLIPGTKAETVTLTYHANGGTGDNVVVDVAKNDTATLKTDGPTHEPKDGKKVEFLGWSAYPTNIIFESADAVPEGTIIKEIAVGNDPVTVYAVWAYGDPVDPTTPEEKLPVFLYVLNQTDGETTDDPADYSYLATGAKVKEGTSMETPYTGKKAQNQIASWNVGELGNHVGYAEVSSAPVGAGSTWEMDVDGNVTEFSFQIGDETYTNAYYDFTWKKLSYIDRSYKENNNDTEWKPAFHLDGVLTEKEDPVDPENPEWQVSKGKTATALDSNYNSTVTLSLPSAEKPLVSDVVFVLDKSTSATVENQALGMLKQLKEKAAEDGATVKVGVVIFNKEAHVTEWKDLVTEYDAIEEAIKQEISSGTNTHAGLLAAQEMLAADTDVEDSRKHMIFVSDGITYMFEEPAQAINSQQATDGEYAIMAGNDCWGIRHYYEGGDQFIPNDWNTYLQDVESHLDEVKQYIQPYDNMNQDNHIPRGDTELPTTVDVALYKTAKLYHELSEKYHCYAVLGDTGVTNYPWGPNFMTYLADGKKVSFDDIQNDIYYLLDAGSQVVDIIGQGKDDKGNDYNFDVANLENMTITVGGVKLNKEMIQSDEFPGSTTYGFFKGEIADGNYDFVVTYYPDGVADGETREHFVWSINVPVGNFAPAQFSYDVHLTNPQKAKGEYKVETNVEAVLTPVDSNGTVGSTETFPVPELTYEVKGGGSTTEHLMTVIVEGKGNVVVKDVQTVGANDTEVVEIPFGVEKQKFEMEAADGWKLDKVEVTINGKTENLGDVDKYEMDESLIDGAVLKAVFVKDNDGGSGGGGSHRPNNKPDETPEALNGDDHFDYVVGYSDGLVHPERNITRAEVASIFFRLLQDDVREKNLTDQNPFNDVFTDDWFNVAVSTMYDMDIVYGRDNNNFDPNAYITRAEFAAIAARFDSEGYSGENLFTDIDGHWAANQINRAAEKGWISGYPDGTFGPDRYITRAEAVTMINRVLNRLPESADALHEDMNVFPDNMDTTAWYYLAIQEATSSHEYEKDKDGVYETWTDVLPDRDWAQYLKLN